MQKLKDIVKRLEEGLFKSSRSKVFPFLIISLFFFVKVQEAAYDCHLLVFYFYFYFLLLHILHLRKPIICSVLLPGFTCFFSSLSVFPFSSLFIYLFFGE